MQKIKKAIIAVAGRGTRFLPATKAVPKEMLPVVDKPILQYVIESVVASGIEEIVIVTSPGKEAIEKHFTKDQELIDFLRDQGKEDKIEEIEKITSLAKFTFINQTGPYGNATPILCSRDLIGDEPFAVIWGDEFYHSPAKPHLKQLIDVYNEYGLPVLTAYKTDDEGTKKYGIIDAEHIKDNAFKVKTILEKPGPDATTSRIASLGGFIFTPDIFEELDKITIGKNNELWLADAIDALMKKKDIYACMIEGDYHDTGSKLGYLRATVEMGLLNPELGKKFREYLKTVV